MSVRDKLNDFVQREFSESIGLPMPGPEDPLLSSAGGVIDSLGLQKLIVFIESELGIEVRDEDIVPQTFETLTALQSYVESRDTERASGMSL